MATEKTLGILKPDALEKGIIGELVSRAEAGGLKVVGLKLLKLTKEKAEGFYAVHKEKPFFRSLVAYMTSGPVVVMALEGTGAVKKWRDIMGATDPEKATEGTIRSDFGTSIERNCSHGSDAAETAKFEIAYFFEPNELVQYEWI